jgi:hypothetical protein
VLRLEILSFLASEDRPATTVPLAAAQDFVLAH